MQEVITAFGLCSRFTSCILTRHDTQGPLTSMDWLSGRFQGCLASPLVCVRSKAVAPARVASGEDNVSVAATDLHAVNGPTGPKHNQRSAVATADGSVGDVHPHTPRSAPHDHEVPTFTEDMRETGL